MTCQKCSELNYTMATITTCQNIEIFTLKRQSEINCWASVEMVRDEVMKGLNVTINQVDGYLDDLVKVGAALFHPTNKGVKRIGEMNHIACQCKPNSSTMEG